jgi:hypothetical protein
VSGAADPRSAESAGVDARASRPEYVVRKAQARWSADPSRRRALQFEQITPVLRDLTVAGRDEQGEQVIRRCLSQS